MITQDKINLMMRQQGEARYREVLNKLPISYHDSGRKLIRSHLRDLIRLLQRDRDYYFDNRDCVPFWYPLIWNYDMKQIALVALNVVMNFMRENTKLPIIAKEIAEAIEDEIRYQHFKMDQGKLAFYLEKDMKFIKGRTRKLKNKKKYWNKYCFNEDFLQNPGREWKYWNGITKVAIGTHFLEAIRRATPFIRIRAITEKIKKVYVVGPSEKLLEWLHKYHNYRIETCSKLLPMVEEPLPWTSLKKGGFPKGICRKPLISVSNVKQLKYYKRKDVSVPVRAINALAKIPYKINLELLDFFQHCFDKKIPIGSLPEGQVEVPPLPFDPDASPEMWESPEYTTWRKQAASCHALNTSNKDKLLRAATILTTAKIYQRGETIYFPHNMDFRGRIYPMVPGINPQACDLGRSLLSYAEGQKLGKHGHKWLKVHGANCFGLSKVSFHERLEFIEEHLHEIEATGLDPKGNLDFLLEAEEPGMFAAFCIEYAKLRKSGDPEDFVSYLPIYQDASNNAYQIYSLLTRNKDTARLCNIDPHLKDTNHPRDFYFKSLEIVKEKLKRSNHPIAKEWVKSRILNRDTLKKVIIGMPFGVSQHTIEDKIDRWHMEQTNRGLGYEFKSGRYSSIMFLAATLYRTFNKVIAAEKETMKWLKEAVVPFIEAGKGIKWRSPSGMLCLQKTLNYSTVNVETVLSGFKSTLKVLDEDSPLGIHGKRMKLAFPANYIHSLDAAVVHLVINEAKKNNFRGLTTVHDCFATHAGSMEQLRKIVLEKYFTVFSKNRLEILLKQFSTQFDDYDFTCNGLTFGDLEVSDVLGSRYLIS